MVIDDLNLVSVTFAKFKTDTPAIVDRHRPLSLMHRRDKIAKLFCAEGAGPESMAPNERRAGMDSGFACYTRAPE
jgi:hypothetical protein